MFRLLSIDGSSDKLSYMVASHWEAFAKHNRYASREAVDLLMHRNKN